MANPLTAGDSARLSRAVGLLDLTMLGAGAAIGVSIFSVLAPAAKVGGAGILLTILIAAAPMGVFAIVYGFMASVMPKSGASYEWPREFIHPFFGFLIAWLRMLGSVGALITLSLVLVQYASAVLPLPARPAMLCVLGVVFLANVRGIKLAARAQTVAMALLIACLTVFVCFGLPRVRVGTIGNPLAAGVMPVIAATPLLISLFLGIETATEIGEEVKDARHTIPKALALAMALTVAVYSVVTITTLGLLGPARLAQSPAPILQAARLVLGPLATPLVLSAAIVSLLKSLNALFIVFSRYLFAMARAGVLPAALARVHARWRTPHFASAAAFGCTLIGLALPRDLVFLFVAVSIPTILKYMSTCLCALQVVHSRKDLARGARFKLGERAVARLAWLGIACALAIFAIGLDTDWKPYVLVAAWAVAGGVYWLAR